MDPQLVEKIVHEVKSQGVFDEFRKDSMADVDTKPAYQNLRQRVESAVKKFLSDQRWSPDMNKNQLRERLRRHIANSGFLDVGVERIVDQVVNPKIGSVFQPRIEEIAYKYLGIPWPPPLMKYEPPPPLIHHQFPPLPLGAPPPLKVEMTSASLLPTDLEQVSPDSDRATVKSECKDDEMDIEERMDDDDESPPFEPLIKCSSPIKRENEAHESDVELEAEKNNTQAEQGNKDPTAAVATNISKNVNATLHVDTETQDTSMSVNTGEPESEKEASRSLDAVASQESQLSEVSSNSRLSVISPDFTESTTAQRKQQSLENAAVNISEEAQMPKFNENSSETFNDQNVSQLHFDIKKDEIKFEGTERKPNLPPMPNEERLAYGEPIENNADTLSIKKEEELKKETDESFQLTEQRDTDAAAATATTTTANTTNDSSFGSSLEDTLSSAQLCISDKVKNEQSNNTNNTTQAEQKSYSEISNTEPISAIPVPISIPKSTTQEKREKPESSSTRHTSASSSTSRHTKHAKDKYRSHEKSSSKDRQRDKSRDRHSKSKHSSSSSKHSSSSSSKRSSSTSDHKRTTITTKHATSSSSSSSNSRTETNETKRENGSTDKINSTSKKNGRKSAGNGNATTSNDDHFELKEKMQRKKSTDSNDDDKNYGSNTNTTAGHNSTAKESNSASSNNKTSNKSKNHTSDGKYTKKSTNEQQQTQQNQMEEPVEQPVEQSLEQTLEQTVEPEQSQHRNKVIILNDILENPTTKSIELETNTHIVNHVQIVPSAITNITTLSPTNLPEAADENQADNLSVINNDLLFFEEISNSLVKERLNLLNSVLDSCRKIVNNLQTSSEMEVLTEQQLQKDGMQVQCSSNMNKVDGNETKATLVVDCIRYRCSSTSSGGGGGGNGAEKHHYDSMNVGEHEGTPPKRFKYNDINCETKTSPTSSDASVNSKENQIFDKNTVGTKKPAFAGKRRRCSVNKLSQQRYTSEDLYKPRPLLSQRSKRRGEDSII